MPAAPAALAEATPSSGGREGIRSSPSGSAVGSTGRGGGPGPAL
eukprot:CAMPEP_0206621866 /NCGR_PEP_ID=MMETSP0325_2-20121206/62449_1 /ASSEMBLY_ACC=CAM_ASM_000347 /TAXON_ID=2866 /ORGANISM="Crypthecodinium cohnii, Strain Seligo" /LENGTH=43 /DNA_ID= /DNA_START= /DNA_END= /DNA_ORIENTATION=